eukprot:SAG31_NODE_207_length_20316_cov_20.465400_7_plen_93_part_00
MENHGCFHVPRPRGAAGWSGVREPRPLPQISLDHHILLISENGYMSRSGYGNRECRYNRPGLVVGRRGSATIVGPGLVASIRPKLFHQKYRL